MGVRLGLILVLLLAAFLRLWQLEVVPPGIYPDEAQNATDAIQTLETKQPQIFYPANNGREGLFNNLTALSFAVFGISIWSFKIVPAIAGILTILGQYLLSKELLLKILDKKRAELAALLAAFLLAVSFWHINFSRIQFRAILLPLVLSFAFFFLLRGMRTRKLWNFAAAGVIYGLGAYTYISFRLSALLVAAALLIWLFQALKEQWGKRFIVSVCAFSFIAIAISTPLLLYFASHPEFFVSRAEGVSIFAKDNPLLAFGESAAKHLAMFHVAGDQNWRHNFAGRPQLSVTAGLFFLLAIAYAFKKWNGSYALLFIWFFALLLPGVLTFEGTPHALRVIGVIPALYALAGLGGALFFFWLKNILDQKKAPRTLFPILLGFFLTSSAIVVFNEYFLVWAKMPQVQDAFTARFVEAGTIANDLPAEARKYVVESEGDLPTETVKFIQRTGGKQDAIFISIQDAETRTFQKGDFLITMNQERGIIDALLLRYPQGILKIFPRVFLYVPVP
ncbi:MAG: glycosyltransferase family 39 protein [Parcubacteria group bacterium]|nr:glycosyltransferase family 39 protein [Parcubacteria group bacterium]